MSASQNKKRRQQERQQGLDKRVTRDETARKAKKMNRTITIAATAIVAVFLAIVIVFSSNGFYRSSKAVRVEDTDYTIADFNFYYYTEYFKYYASAYSQYGDYAAYMLPSRGQSFASQMYSDDMTWADYFEEKAMTYLKEMTVMYNEAKAKGYKLSEESQKELESELEYSREAAKEQGISLNKYYSSMYGKGVNEAVYARNLEKVQYVADYVQEVYDSYEYTQDELDAHYEKNKNDLDWFEYRYFYLAVSGQSGKDGDEGKDKIAAKENAEAFVSAVKSVKDFNEQAKKYASESTKTNYDDEEYTLRNAQGVGLAEDYKEWMTSKDRKEGDVTSVLAKDGKGYYILYFVGRDGNDYNMVNVRHLLIEVPTLNKSKYDSDAAYEAAVEEEDKKAREEIEKIYKEWKDGDADEKSFGKLADKHSDDNSEGGLYEDVYKNRMTKAFNDWCFDAKRKAGDNEIIRSEYGYHLMYYIGEGDLYRDYLADTDMRNDEYTSWKEAMVKDAKSKTNWKFSFVG